MSPGLCAPRSPGLCALRARCAALLQPWEPGMRSTERRQATVRMESLIESGGGTGPQIPPQPPVWKPAGAKPGRMSRP